MVNKFQQILLEKNRKAAIQYEDIIDGLRSVASIDLPRYMNNQLPLFTREGPITVAEIEVALISSLEKGINYVEYTVHKHYYPGFRGNNLSFLTGKYYIRADGGFADYVEVYGCPCLLDELRTLLGVVVSFREVAHNNGVLRIEVPFVSTNC